MTAIEEPVESDDAVAEAIAEANELGVHRSLRSDVWRQFKRHKGAMVGVVTLTLVIIGTVIGPMIYPFEANGSAAIDVTMANQKPGWPHIMGTDNLGRDVAVRSLIGGRISLAVGFAAMLFSIFLGTAIGVLAGFFRWLDGPLMRITDLFLSLPLLPVLLLVIVLFRGPLTDSLGDTFGIFILVVFIIGATSWMQTARIVRGEVLSIKEQEFVLASRSIGTRQRRIIIQHVVPNVLSPVIVAASLGIAVSILTESALSFLGLGFPADFPTWGRLLFDAKDAYAINYMRILGPGFLLSLTVMSVNFIGDGLRDALDPKLRGHA